MSEALILVVLLGTSVDPSAEAMLASVRRALGPEATVLADTSNAPTDATALEIGGRVHARAIARISWADGAANVARLHVHVAPSATTDWSDQEIKFGPQDSAAEKGRTVGNALAAMVERIEHDRATDTAVAVVPPKPERPPPPAPRPPPPPPIPMSFNEGGSLDLFALGAGALGRDSTSIGGAVGARWWPVPSVGFRLAAGARLGSIAEADATMRTLFAGVGPGYRLRFRDLELGARVDFLVLRHDVTRTRPVETTRTRWVGALDLVFEASWAFGRHTGVFAGVGPEFALGTTEIDIGGVRTADIAPVRGVAELGLRIRF